MSELLSIETLHSELQELAQTIQQTRSAIAAIQPLEITDNHIPLATDQLDAVVSATEEATNKIMDQCDEITKISSKIEGPISDELIACTTRIFEACNFQDITGQRITKVVGALKHIDSKVDALLKTLMPGMLPGKVAEPATVIDPDQALLNGPQSADKAISQDDIDKLLNS